MRTAQSSSVAEAHIDDAPDTDDTGQYELEIIDPCKPPRDKFPAAHFAARKPIVCDITDRKHSPAPSINPRPHLLPTPADQVSLHTVRKRKHPPEWGGWRFVRDPDLVKKYDATKPLRGEWCLQELDFNDNEARRIKYGRHHRILPCDRSRCLYIHEGQLEYKETDRYQVRVRRNEMKEWGDILKQPKLSHKNVVKFVDDVGNIPAKIQKGKDDRKVALEREAKLRVKIELQRQKKLILREDNEKKRRAELRRRKLARGVKTNLRK